jgi:hypothetical protein
VGTQQYPCPIQKLVASLLRDLPAIPGQLFEMDLPVNLFSGVANSIGLTVPHGSTLP